MCRIVRDFRYIGTWVVPVAFCATHSALGNRRMSGTSAVPFAWSVMYMIARWMMGVGVPARRKMMTSP